MRTYVTIYRHGSQLHEQVTKRPDDEELYVTDELEDMRRRQLFARCYAEAKAAREEKRILAKGFCPKCHMLIPLGLDHCPDCEE